MLKKEKTLMTNILNKRLKNLGFLYIKKEFRKNLI